MASNQISEGKEITTPFANSSPAHVLSDDQHPHSKSEPSTSTVKQTLSDQSSATGILSSQASGTQISNMPTSQSSASSIRTTSATIDSASRPLLHEQRSSFGKVVDTARSRMTGSEKPPSSEADIERAQAKEVEKQKRREEYERLGLADRTKYGMPGAGGFNA